MPTSCEHLQPRDSFHSFHPQLRGDVFGPSSHRWRSACCPPSLTFPLLAATASAVPLPPSSSHLRTFAPSSHRWRSARRALPHPTPACISHLLRERRLQDFQGVRDHAKRALVAAGHRRRGAAPPAGRRAVAVAERGMRAAAAVCRLLMQPAAVRGRGERAFAVRVRATGLAWQRQVRL